MQEYHINFSRDNAAANFFRLPEEMAALECIVIDDFEQEGKMSKPMVRPERVAGNLAGLVCGGYLG